MSGTAEVGSLRDAALVASSLRLGAYFAFALLAAGSVSALTTVLRMRSSGLLGNGDSPIPGGGLLDRGRSVLLTLTISYLGAASLAAGELRVAAGSLLGRHDSTLAWIGIWVAYLLLLVIGTVALKAMALARPVGYLRAMRPWIWILHGVLRPVSLGLEIVMNRLVPAIWTLDLSPPLGGSEIRGLLADEEAKAHMESDEVNWARSIFELGDTEISEIMVPRIDMVAIDVETPFEEALPIAAASRFTRLPVYEGNADRILGILHTKDLLSASVRGETPTIRDLLRPVHFLPESKAIDEALAEFREGRIHLAVVVDEYGGTAGIVTLEDILEEIVGEIRDEFDQEGELVRVVDAHTAVIDPRIDIDDLNEMFGLELPSDENDTLGGLLYQLCGKVPVRGDSVEYDDLEFTIDRVERQRIRQVTLRSASPLRVETPESEVEARK